MNLDIKYIVPVVLAVCAGFALIISVALSGDPNDSPTNVRVKVVERSHSNALPAFIKISYKIKSKDNKAPGTIAVYLHPEGSQSAERRVLVNRILPFSPPNSEGVRQATVQVPKELAQLINNAASPVAVELEFDPSLTAAVPEEGTLSLESVTILGDQ